MRVRVAARDRLARDCYAVAEQIRTVDRARLGDGPLAVLDAGELGRLERSVMGVLGIRPGDHDSPGG